MAVTLTTTADAFAEKLIGEKGSVTDPETGEITGTPKKRSKLDAGTKYAM